MTKQNLMKFVKEKYFQITNLFLFKNHKTDVAKLTKQLILEAKEKFKIKNRVDENLPFKAYCLSCYINCNPQSYGSKIENKVIKIFNFEKLKKKLGQGDFKVVSDSIIGVFPCLKENDRVEFKVSFLSGEENQMSYNFIQMRPHDKFEYYVLVAIDLDYSDDDVFIEWYVIKKEDVVNDNFKLGLTHGNEENTKNNETVEHKLSVVKNSEQHKKLKELNLLEWKTFSVD